MMLRGGQDGLLCERVFVGGLKDLIYEKNEEGYAMIEVHPEGCMNRVRISQ